jgi:hypothetical protein
MIGDKSKDYYRCETCKYSTNNKTDMNRHEKCKKHNRLINKNIVTESLGDEASVTDLHEVLTDEEKRVRIESQLSRMAPNERVAIINNVTKVKRYGTAAPTKTNIFKYIESHPEWEILFHNGKKHITKKEEILKTLDYLRILLNEVLDD